MGDLAEIGHAMITCPRCGTPAPDVLRSGALVREGGDPS